MDRPSPAPANDPARPPPDPRQGPQRQQQLKTHFRVRVVRHRKQVVCENAAPCASSRVSASRIAWARTPGCASDNAVRNTSASSNPIPRSVQSACKRASGRRSSRAMRVRSGPASAAACPPATAGRACAATGSRAPASPPARHWTGCPCSRRPASRRRAPLRADAVNASPVAAVVQLSGRHGRLVHPLGMLHDLAIIIHHIQGAVRPHIRIHRTKPAIRRRQKLFPFVEAAGPRRSPRNPPPHPRAPDYAPTR